MGLIATRFVVPSVCAFPARRTARRTLERCGVMPDKIAWHVTKDRVFTFGRKSPDAAPMTPEQGDCLMGWVNEKRIKVAFIGWELKGR